MRLAHWLPPVVWMAIIIGLSSDAASAEHTSRFILPSLRWLFPTATPGQLEAAHALVRKLGHVTEYAILALLWFRAFRRGAGRGPRPSAGLAFLISVAWAALDEAHQTLVPSRTASAGDVLIDATGALVALLVATQGWRATVDRATLALLWIAAVGGAAVLALDTLVGVGGGPLWVTVPAAATLLLAIRRLRRKA